MLSRRVLLGGVALATLAGCGVLPEQGDPRIAPTPDPSVPGHRALQALRDALTAAASGPLDRAQADLLAWALDVNDDQYEATSLAPPADPRPTPSPAATPADLGSLTGALGTARTAFTEQALDPTTARPLVWASMAAWCVAVAAQLPDAPGAREPARGVRLPAPQEPQAAAQAALDAASAAVYGLQVAAGAPGLSEAEVGALRARLTSWTGLRDDLTAQARVASASPTPGPPWYAVPPVADASAGRALAARVQAAALPVLGRTIAPGPADLRPLLIDALGATAADVPVWGGLLERWPGLPST